MPMAIMAESFVAAWRLPWRAVVCWRLDSTGTRGLSSVDLFHVLLARYCVLALFSRFCTFGFFVDLTGWLLIEAFVGVLPSLAARPSGQSALQLLCGTIGGESVEMGVLDLAITVCTLIQHSLFGTSLQK